MRVAERDAYLHRATCLVSGRPRSAKSLHAHEHSLQNDLLAVVVLAPRLCSPLYSRHRKNTGVVNFCALNLRFRLSPSYVANSGVEVGVTLSLECFVCPVLRVAATWFVGAFGLSGFSCV